MKINNRKLHFRFDNSHGIMNPFHILPTIEVQYLSGFEVKNDFKIGGFWILQFAWLRMEFNIYLDDKI